MNKPYENFCTRHETKWTGSLPAEKCPWCDVEALTEKIAVLNTMAKNLEAIIQYHFGRDEHSIPVALGLTLKALIEAGKPKEG
jgi:hypothetical protein